MFAAVALSGFRIITAVTQDNIFDLMFFTDLFISIVQNFSKK